jgi:membrane dipeptidase
LDRRDLLKAALGLGFVLAEGRQVRARDPIYLADMHFHLFFGGRNPPEKSPLATVMKEGDATLVAWSLVGDLLWFDGKHPYAQKAVPRPGEAFGWFQREIGRIRKHIAEQHLKIVRDPADVALALRGDPHVVLAVEGATFIEDDVSRLKAAYDLGVRHLQLVHYIRNPLADFQTTQPEHGGLTELGKKVIVECNRLGILIDLAHCTEPAVNEALALSSAPMVWSHSSVVRSGQPNWNMITWRARQLTLAAAKDIARKGGVVGLWALRVDVGKKIEDYARRLWDMADWLGEDHVAFGTDLNGLGDGAMAWSYADLRRVVEHWQNRKMPEARIRKIANGNYARVLRDALRPRAPRANYHEFRDACVPARRGLEASSCRS